MRGPLQDEIYPSIVISDTCSETHGLLPVWLSFTRCKFINHPVILPIQFKWHKLVMCIRLQWPSGSSKARQKAKHSSERENSLKLSGTQTIFSVQPSKPVGKH